MPKGSKAAPPQHVSLGELWGKKKVKSSAGSKVEQTPIQKVTAEPEDRNNSGEPSSSHVPPLKTSDESRPTKKRRVVESDDEDTVTVNKPCAHKFTTIS